jgi:hypothetical protein
VAKNGNVYNIWTLNLENGELQQYTDALGANLSPVPLKGDVKGHRVAFITYYKGDYGLAQLDLSKPLKAAASADFGAPGPIIDFQAPLNHTMVADNKKKKGTFEKLFLEGRPPISVGVTNNGDIFGGTEISFSDVLGDHRFGVTAASISQYRTFGGSYLNLSKRFQWALQGFTQTVFFYGQYAGLFYDPAYSPFIDRDLAVATRTVRGGNAFGIYPLDAYRRIEVSAGILQYRERYNDQALQDLSGQYQQQQFGRTLFNNGTFVPSESASRRKRPCSASSARWPATPCGSATSTRPVSEARSRARHSTSISATTSGWREPRCWRCGRAASRASGTSRTISSSAATTRCGGTTTWSSSARTPRSQTPSCASR